MARYDDDDDDDDIDDRKGRGRGSRESVPNYLMQAILTTVCCGCLPIGILAIVKAASVNSLLAQGKYSEAVAASEEAKKWCWISFGIGVVLGGIGIVLQVVAAMNDPRFR